MYSFLVRTKPQSYNSRKKKKYGERIISAFQKSYPDHIPLKENLYGLVYHFYKKSGGHDADNISKPVWDCLRNVVYDDDKRIKMRVVGSFEVSNDYITMIGPSALSGNLVADLLEALDNEDHLLYIECGTFLPEMIQLNIEQNAD